MSTIIKCLLFSLLINFCGSVFGQDEKQVEFLVPTFDVMGLDFYMPTENSYKFKKIRSTEFFDYDTRIRAKSREMEILIALHPSGVDSVTTYHPHIEFQRLLGNLSPNDDDQNILVVGWRVPKLMERNADWGAEAYFRPREDITSFPFAKLVSFYKEGQGMVVMLYCFDKPDEVPFLLSFLEDEEE